MDAIQYRPAEPVGTRPLLAALAAAFLLAGIAAPCGAREPLSDGPVAWYELDDRDIPPPEERDPHLIASTCRAALWRPIDRFFHPGRFVRRAGTIFGGDRVPPAANVNALDEVPSSTWFTNRIGLRPWSPEQVARGPGGEGPDRSEKWLVIGAKIGGVTPGFRIRDARGDLYLIKFDPPRFPGMTIRAGIVTNRLLHAAGYNVPQDRVVTFTEDDLNIEAGVRCRLPGGGYCVLTREKLYELLGDPAPDTGAWCALASKFLAGTPVGPFDYKGRRGDDPNDRIAHEHRRELRALRLFSAWLNHFDMKEQNTLDVYVEQDGRRFVRHYLIDFASSLGAGGSGPNPKLGYEYGFDLPAVGGKLLSLGIHDDQWAHLERPDGLWEIGYFDGEAFDPDEWKAYQPNTAFANLAPRDAYWAAKIISAFTRDHIAAAVAEAQYVEPAAADYLIDTLVARRDAIVRKWFDRVPPLDFFTCDGEAVDFRDLGVERGPYAADDARYRARWAAVTAERKTAGWTPWRSLAETRVPLATAATAREADERYPFLALDVQVDRGDGWSPSTKVYLDRDNGRVVALDR
jgi:hypothetical protein